MRWNILSQDVSIHAVAEQWDALISDDAADETRWNLILRKRWCASLASLVFVDGHLDKHIFKRVLYDTLGGENDHAGLTNLPL